MKKVNADGIIEFKRGLPFDELKSLIKDESVSVLWMAFAYFSTEILKEILLLIREKKSLEVHLIIAASSSNPMNEVATEILSLIEYKENCTFYIVNSPLMHSKLFVGKRENNFRAYFGSANLTKNAISGNIETGVVFECKDGGIEKYLRELTKDCDNQNSVEVLKQIALLSHLKSELLYISLEESKLTRATLVKPNSVMRHLKKLESSTGDEFLSIKNTTTLGIPILEQEDRLKLNNIEIEVKNYIKEHIAIKLEAYGWVSSSWTLRKFINNSDEDNKFKDLTLFLKDIKKKYSNKAQRKRVASNIKSAFRKSLSDQSLIVDDKTQADDSIDAYIKQFDLDCTHKKSPYRQFWKAVNRLLDHDDLNAMYSLYKIGDNSESDDYSCTPIRNSDSDSDSDSDDLHVLTVDQVNLSAMCYLAIKLRSRASLNVPCVWWFDIALDEYAYKILGYKNLTDYREHSVDKLRDIADRVLDDKNQLAICLREFCEVTGFSLAHPYPEFDELIAFDDKELSTDEWPFVFIRKITPFSAFIDGADTPSKTRLCLVSSLSKLTKEFLSRKITHGDINKGAILGQNICLLTDENMPNTIFFYGELNQLKVED